MKRKANWQIAAWDIGTILCQWSLWFLGVIVLVHLALSIVTQGAFDDFLSFSALSAPGTFFVFGIIGGVAFLPDLVKQGVSRKNAFIGNVLGMAMSVVFVIAVALIVTLIEQGVTTLLGADIVWESALIEQLLGEDFLTAGNSLGSWVLAFLSYFLNLFFSYLAGWLIGTSFYGRGLLAGAAAILVILSLFAAMDFVSESGLFQMVLTDNVVLFGSSVTGAVALLMLLLFSALLLAGIRLITRRMPIKL